MKENTMTKEKEINKAVIKDGETLNVKPTYSYYSNLLGKVFTNVDDLLLAEKEYKDAKNAELEKVNAKKERAKEIENAYKYYIEVVEKANKEIADAKGKYYELRNKFVKDYGSFHMTYSNNDNDVKVSDVVNTIFDAFRSFPYI